MALEEGIGFEFFTLLQPTAEWLRLEVPSQTSEVLILLLAVFIHDSLSLGFLLWNLS